MEIAVSVVVSVVAACIVGLINWLFSQPGRARNEFHALDIRVTKAESRLENVDGRVTKTENSIEYIKENMVCKDDFNAGLDRIEKIIHGE